MIGPIKDYFEDVSHDTNLLLTQTIFRATGKNYQDLSSAEMPSLPFVLRAFARVGRFHLTSQCEEAFMRVRGVGEIIDVQGNRAGFTRYNVISLAPDEHP